MNRNSSRWRLEELESRALPSSPGDVEWVRQLGTFRVPDSLDPARSIVADGSGNVYVVGDVPAAGALPGLASAGGEDSYVRKYDAAGTELWTRQFGTAADERALGVGVDDSGVYIVGYTFGTLPGQTSAGAEDVFVRKYDPFGNELWTRQFGTNSQDIPTSAAVDATGVYVAGFTGGALPGQTSAGDQDAFVRKYDAAGNELWTRQFGTSTRDVANAVAAGPTGVYVAGTTLGALPGQTSAGDSDAFVRMYDAAGNVVWTRQFGTPTTDLANGIAVDASGVYVTGGTGGSLSGPNDTGFDAFVRRYDADGTEVWTRQFGSTATSFDLANGVAVDASGVSVAGRTVDESFGDVAFLRRFDTNGAEVWSRQFGPSIGTEALGVAADSSGVYVAGDTSGTFPNQTAYGGVESFVRKYDTGGADVWTRQFAGVVPTDDFARATATDAAGNVYVAGGLGGPLPGSPVTGGMFVRKYDAAGTELWTRQFGERGDSALAVTTDGSTVYVAGLFITLNGFEDAFVRKYDGDGNEIWTRQFGSSATDYATAVALDPTGVYVAGFTFGALPGQTSAGHDDVFVRKYDTAGNELWTRQFGTGGSDQATGITADASGVDLSGFTTGTLSGQPSAGGQDAFMRRYDTAGNEMWTRQFGTPDTDAATGVAADASGIYVSGFAGGILVGQTGAGGQDALVRKYDLAGNTLWTRQFGTSGADQALGVTAGPSGIYLAGTTGGSLPGRISAGSEDAFVRKYDDAGTELWTGQFGTAGTDSALGVAVGAAGLFVAGSTTGTFPGEIDPLGVDAFAARIVDSVGPAATTTVASVDPPTPLFGVDGVTITAAVSVVAPGTGTPTGTVTFSDGGTVLGTADVVNGVASLALGNTALAAGTHTIRAVYGGTDDFQGSESTVELTVLAPSVVQGLVYVDFNDDGQVDFGERAVAGVTVTLTGADDLGHAVSRSVSTDANGVYAFTSLRPSDAAGYTVAETQPAGLPDGRDTPGTVNGSPAGTAAVNDTFSGIVLSQGGSLAENYNFGERPAAAGGVTAGQTATIGFWQNRNGQALVQALNGGSTATQLGHWLATTLPNLYGALDGRTNAEVAAYYKTLFARTVQTAPGGPPKVDAQVMATALAVYVTNQSLAGTAAAAFGFLATADGLGTRTVDVAGDGAAFGVSDNSTHSVLDLLLAADARSHAGLLEDADADGRIDATEAGGRTQVNAVFTAINEAGDI